MSSDQQIHFSDLAKGLLSQAGDAPRMAKGMLRMAANRPWRRQSIGRLVERHADKRPDTLALRSHAGDWTYATLNARANRYAHALQADGVGSGDVVALGLGNAPETLAAVTGIVKLGAIAALLPSHQRGEPLAHSLAISKARLVIANAEMAAAIDAARDAADTAFDGKRWLLGADDPLDGWQAADERLDRAATSNPRSTRSVRLEQPCYYIFTSGTTGLPKASVMTHYRFAAALAGVGDTVVRLKAGETLYCPLPLYHNNALTVSWGAVLAAGAALAVVPKFSASRFWDDVQQFEAVAFCYIGELCRYLLNQPGQAAEREHRVRVVVGTGLRPELWPAFKRRFGIPRVAEFYGASEGNLAFINAFNQDATAGYCPMSYAIVAYDAESATPQRDADGRLRKVDSGEVGLLISEVTKLARFDGYTDESASEQKLLRGCFKDGDCWFNTGDLVRDQGWHHIQFVDRLGDTFRWKGENVSTTEVERALVAFDQIEEAVVYGVQVPGADGRAGMAALTLADGETLDTDALAEHLAQALPDYAVPIFLRRRGEQTATSTFKYRKTDLKEQGFDPEACGEPLWWRHPGSGKYKSLGDGTFEALMNQRQGI